MAVPGMTDLSNPIPTKQYEFPRPSDYLSLPDIIHIFNKKHLTHVTSIRTYMHI